MNTGVEIGNRHIFRPHHNIITPGTFYYLKIMAAAFGKILGMVGGMAQSKANLDDQMGAASKFKFDSKMALRNAELARQDQLIAAESGAVDRSNISKGEAVTRGETRSAFAGGNVRVDEGTPLEFDIAVAEQAATERERPYPIPSTRPLLLRFLAKMAHHQ